MKRLFSKGVKDVAGMWRGSPTKKNTAASSAGVPTEKQVRKLLDKWVPVVLRGEWEIEVELVKRKELFDKGAIAQSATVAGERRVQLKVARDLSWTREYLEFALLHELGHVLLDETGVSRAQDDMLEDIERLSPELAGSMQRQLHHSVETFVDRLALAFKGVGVA